MRATPKDYWPPLIAGAVLGLTLVASFIVTGHGLGASGLFVEMTVGIWQAISPQSLGQNSYLGGYKGFVPLTSWISFEVLGLFAGAFAGSLFSGRFRLCIERGKTLSRPQRLAGAFAGGMLVGIGSRFARGCTSGLGLSGSATLAVAGFLFLIAFFASGLVVTLIARRLWQ